MMMKNLLVLALAAAAVHASVDTSHITGAGDNVPYYPKNYEQLAQFDIRTYGAVGDGTTLNTAAFTKAFEAASRAGGGVVVVADGRYVTATFELRSNVYLEVRDDAALLGSYVRDDYPIQWGEGGVPVIVHCVGQTNTGIIGGGILDGQALPHFIAGYSKADDEYIPVTWTGGPQKCGGECRPRLVQFERCHNVLVRDVTLQNSPDWTSHYIGCKNVLIHNITVFGDFRWPNCDGIDPDSSVNVTISQCDISTGDDGICPKSTAGFGPLENLLVENNIVRSRSGAFKIGSSTAEDIHDVLVRNLYVETGTNRGLGIQHRDAGHVYDVHFEDITIDGTQFQPNSWWGAAEPLWITSIPRQPNWTVGTVHDIYFRNVTARRSENGALFSSRTHTPLRNINLNNVHLTIDSFFPPRPGLNYSVIEHDYRPASPPDTVPGPLDAFYFENVETGALLHSSAVFAGPSNSHYGRCVNGANWSGVRQSDIRCVSPA